MKKSLRNSMKGVVCMPADITATEKSLKQVWDSAMREAAGLVCGYCKKGDVPGRWSIDNEGNPITAWLHGLEHGNEYCDAHAIHERLALKGER